MESELHGSFNRVRYAMNNYVISVGAYVQDLNAKAKLVAAKIGKVNVDVGETVCKVLEALAYIEKTKKMGRLGKKKKQARC